MKRSAVDAATGALAASEEGAGAGLTGLGGSALFLSSFCRIK
jgi:hypothetical protein